MLEGIVVFAATRRPGVDRRQDTGSAFEFLSRLGLDRDPTKASSAVKRFESGDGVDQRQPIFDALGLLLESEALEDVPLPRRSRADHGSVQTCLRGDHPRAYRSRSLGQTARDQGLDNLVRLRWLRMTTGHIAPYQVKGMASAGNGKRVSVSTYFASCVDQLGQDPPYGALTVAAFGSPRQVRFVGRLVFLERGATKLMIMLFRPIARVGRGMRKTKGPAGDRGTKLLW